MGAFYGRAQNQTSEVGPRLVAAERGGAWRGVAGRGRAWGRPLDGREGLGPSSGPDRQGPSQDPAHLQSWPRGTNLRTQESKHNEVGGQGASMVHGNSVRWSDFFRFPPQAPSMPLTEAKKRAH